MNQSWPLLVVKNENHPIPKLKLKTYYNGMLKEHNTEEKGYLTDCMFPEFDPFKLVGNETSEGKITEDDAKVMKKIYEGPKYRDGKKMYGRDFMGPAINFWDLYLMFKEKGLKPIKSSSDCSIQTFRWTLKRPELKWEDIIYELIKKIYEFGVSEGKELDNLAPDLRRFRYLKRKMILCHDSGDFCCSLETSLKYYNDIKHYASKTEKELKEFVICYGRRS